MCFLFERNRYEENFSFNAGDFGIGSLREYGRLGQYASLWRDEKRCGSGEIGGLALLFCCMTRLV